MASEQQQPTIARSAELCLRSFQQCLQQSASVHARELSLVEDQLARFSIWTSNIGVFAPGRASMDHRLREVPDIQDVVRGLLDALDDCIQNCLSVLETLGNSQLEKSESTAVAVDEIFDRSIRAIANEISLLHRLSNTIRRASKESQNLKAAKLFRIQDDEGNDAEQLLQELFANYIHDRFPGISDTIRQRLASTILLRRKRILYRRARYGDTPIRPKKTISQPTITLPPSQQQITVVPEQKQGSDGPEVAAKSAQSIVQSLAVSATTLAADSFKKASTPSVVSVTKTVALDNHEDLVFPPAPNGRAKQKYKQLKKQREEEHKAYLKSLLDHSLYEEHSGQPPPLGLGTLSSRDKLISDAEAKLQKTLEKDWKDCNKAIVEVTCPFCFYALPSLDVIDEKKWKAHVKNDLDPYICLFEECDTPEELYKHSDDWLKHMREHALRWRCNSKSHGGLVFVTRDDYVGHMRTIHEGTFTEAQLRVLAERNARTIGPMFESCPLCGVEEVKGRLEDHIVGHLRFLALKYLPSYQDEGSESSKSEKASLGTSKPASRSTIKKDPERYLKPTFDDVGEQLNIQGFDGSDRSAPSPYAAWGGFRNYISQSSASLKDSPMATDATTLEMPPQPFLPFLPPPIPDDGEYQPLSWSKDPSIEFVEESLFTGVPDTNRRRFEWGFLTESQASSKSLENDSIIQSILKRKREQLIHDSIPPAQPKGTGPLAASGTTDEQKKVVSNSGNNDLESCAPLDLPTVFGPAVADDLIAPYDVNEQEPETRPPSFPTSLDSTKSKGSSLRPENDPPSPLPKFSYIERKGALDVRCSFVDIVHGLFSAESGVFATLIILECQFNTLKQPRRFQSVDISLEFRGMQPEETGPQVYAIAPDGKSSLMLTTRDVELKQSASLQLGSATPFGGATATLAARWEKSVSRDTSDEVTLMGSIHLIGRNWGKPNCASWTLLENPITNTGVPTSLRTAILLMRKNKDRFQCVVKIHTKVDFASAVENIFKSRNLSAPILFDPEMKPTNNLREYDVEGLGSLDLDSLTTVLSTVEKG